jgi:hypothetical protein
MLRRHIVGLAAAIAISSAPAHAQLVTNGGFETGDLTGWTRTAIGTCIDQVNSGSARSGSFGFISSPSNSACVYSQSIATTAGQQYDFSFWVSNLGGGANSLFEAFWNGSSVYALTNATASAYTQQFFSVTATSATTDINFVIRFDSNFYMLDDVSVVRSTTTTTVPEPSSVTLMVAGLSGIVLMRRRTRP